MTKGITAPGVELSCLSSLGDYTVEWEEPGRYLLSRRHELYEASSLEPPFRRLGAFPTPAWQRSASLVRLGQRALRFMYFNALPLRDGSVFLTFAKSVGILRHDRIAKLSGIERPCRILRSAAALSAEGDVFFGEYLLNPDRGEMKIYRLATGTDRAEVARVFPARSVRHIHGIFRDPFEDGLWCLSGDVGSECRLMRTTDGFQTLDEVGGGDETWRSVSLLFSPDAIFYAMDAEFTQNYIYRIDRRSGQRTRLAAIDGPVYYSRAAGSQFFFGVTAELCPSQKGSAAELWCVDGESGECRRVLTMAKDHYSVRYFMPGSIDFPAGPGGEGRLLFRGTALSGDGRTFSVRVPICWR